MSVVGGAVERHAVSVSDFNCINIRNELFCIRYTLMDWHRLNGWCFVEIIRWPVINIMRKNSSTNTFVDIYSFLKIVKISLTFWDKATVLRSLNLLHLLMLKFLNIRKYTSWVLLVINDICWCWKLFIYSFIYLKLVNMCRKTWQKQSIKCKYIKINSKLNVVMR